ncbi:VOC family protein [Nocardia bovistercoris]|uniref:VOC family protein n=1 Tax=Nocardia bovistercoris TaxID=2785916 RepID=A0A931N501_9NOCA|nr:VOC family protein [Nocardia bovistercoris]MBH0779242.1 VOC family protein [Nocardia bovistercoris]
MSEITPYLAVADAHAAIDWYISALGAEIAHDPIVMPDGRVGHCELRVAGARWMMSDEHPEIGVEAPDLARGAAVSLHLTVEDCDAAAARVLANGIEMTRGPEDSPPAGRVAVFVDPFGHRWFLDAPVRQR